MGTLMGVLLGLIISLSVMGVVQSRYEKSVHRVRLAGPMDAAVNWVPAAMEDAARGGLIRWSATTKGVRDGDGELVALHTELRSNQGDTILARVPAFPAGDHTDAPLTAEVAIEHYTVTSIRGGAWFGLPASHVRGRRRKVQRRLRKYARQSIQN